MWHLIGGGEGWPELGQNWPKLTKNWKKCTFSFERGKNVDSINRSNLIALVGYIFSTFAHKSTKRLIFSSFFLGAGGFGQHYSRPTLTLFVPAQNKMEGRGKQKQLMQYVGTTDEAQE